MRENKLHVHFSAKAAKTKIHKLFPQILAIGNAHSLGICNTRTMNAAPSSYIF